MFKNILSSIVILSLSISSGVMAQNKSINVVTSAVPFLRISPDARSSGMGDLGIATTPDANSAFWNRAKLPFAQNNSAIAFNYTPWLKGLGVGDVYLLSAAGYKKLDETQAISASIRYFSLGGIQFTDENGNNLNSFNPREFAIDAGYSRKLSSKLGLGIAVKYIRSKLAEGTYNGQTYEAGSSVAADLSLFHDGTGGSNNASGFNWGVSLSNLGSKISYTNSSDEKSFIPANLGIGIAYIKVLDETNKISFGLDLNKLLVPTPPELGGTGSTPASDAAAISKYRNKGVVSSWFNSFSDAPGGSREELREVQASVGAEYSYDNQFMLRAGYFYEAPTKGDRQYITAGAGINFSKVELNFSFIISSQSSTSRSPLENTFRVGVNFNMDK